MTPPYIGEIRLFGFARVPVGWIPCDGRELPSNAYTDLFLVLKDTFGGDGATKFNVPDLRGAVPIHTGTAPGMSPRPLGQTAGREAAKIGPEMPRHSHGVSVSTTIATERSPSPNVTIGALSGDTAFISPSVSGASAMPWDVDAVGVTGQAEPHQNCMPTVTLNFCIAGTGIPLVSAQEEV